MAKDTNIYITKPDYERLTKLIELAGEGADFEGLSVARDVHYTGDAEPISIPAGHYFMLGDNTQAVVRQPRVGAGAARQHHRRGLRRLLAAAANRLSLEFPAGRLPGRLLRHGQSHRPDRAAPAA